MKFMLDTNICIYVMHQQPAEVAARVSALKIGDACMSVITLAELRAGIETLTTTRTHNERLLDQFVRHIPALPFDEAAAHSYGVLRAAVPERRKNALDRLIAAHALSVGAVLVTNNEADFKDYPGLVVENWTSSAL
jgi:tRNA(fMet)-specific endonuclease VapC